MIYIFSKADIYTRHRSNYIKSIQNVFAEKKAEIKMKVLTIQNKKYKQACCGSLPCCNYRSQVYNISQDLRFIYRLLHEDVGMIPL